MKKLLLLIAAMTANLLAFAQPAIPPAPSATPSAAVTTSAGVVVPPALKSSITSAEEASKIERARIAAERAELVARFAAQDKVCYAKFLVNKCLGAVKLERDAALGDLKRQEILLNEQDRKMQAAEQIRKNEEKNSPEAQQAAADRRAAALKDTEARMERERQKNLNRDTAKANEQTNVDAAARRQASNDSKASARTTKQAAEAESAQKFAARQQEAVERKAKHDANQANRTKEPSKPLPVPP